MLGYVMAKTILGLHPGSFARYLIMMSALFVNPIISLIIRLQYFIFSSSPKYHRKNHANWIMINIMNIFITDIQVFAYGKIIDILHFEVLL